MIINNNINFFALDKEKEIKELHDFFEQGKFYCLETAIPIYKNKECFEHKNWSWFNDEESLFLDLININNTRTSYTASNIKNTITVTTTSNGTPPLPPTYIKKPRKFIMFLDFVKNSDNINGADNKTSIICHPMPSAVRTLSQVVCLKFLYQSQIIYVPMHPGHQKTLFKKYEAHVSV